jgi:hypothetical protein
LSRGFIVGGYTSSPGTEDKDVLLVRTDSLGHVPPSEPQKP